MIKKLLKL